MEYTGISYHAPAHGGAGLLHPGGALRAHAGEGVLHGEHPPVICYYPNNDEYTCVKRVIGLEGDTITIEGGIVSVNGVTLKEDYVTTGLTSKHDGTYEVEPGCVFVMGDNRLVSRDSTDGMVGSVPRERVIGRVRRVLLPFSRAKKVESIDYGV